MSASRKNEIEADRSQSGPPRMSVRIDITIPIIGLIFMLIGIGLLVLGIWVASR